LNSNDNANSKPALTKQFKQWMDGAATMAMTVMVMKTTEMSSGSLQKGVGGEKFHCAVFL